MNRSAYVELRCATSFSFLRGASHPSEIVERAGQLGHRRLAITDRDGLYGIVQAYRTGREHGVEIIVGAEIHVTGRGQAAKRTASGSGGGGWAEPDPGGRSALILLATDRPSYGRLTRLLSLGRLRVGKGGFHLGFEDVAAHAKGLMAIHVGTPEALTLSRERDVFGDRLALAVERTHTPFDRGRIDNAQSASARFGVPLVAVGGVLMHDETRKPLQDILSCIRMGVRLGDGGRRLLPNGHARLRSSEQMARAFADLPEAVAHSVEIADRCAFRLHELEQSFTLEVLPEGETGMGYLRKLVEKGAGERYPDGVPESVQKQIEHELSLIETLDFAGYFLTVWDIVRYARSRNILCQGRGSAANSVVCYCLGITSIDPIRMSLLFERFISVERGEPPDIDVDFEHDRREEVMQYVFEKYGRDRAAMVANVIRYRGRLAYREVGKVFGLGDDQIDRLTRTRGHWSAGEIRAEDLKEAGLDPADPTVRQVVRWAEVLQGFPRHLGLHSGGFVITREPLVELAPIENATMENRTVIAWDKRDVETLGLVKVDLLSLGMLTAVHKAFDVVEATEGIRLSLADVPAEDARVYDMISDADTVGTFQVESRAQMQTLPRLKPRTFYDLVVAVAIIRPGPIQGDMVHPYLRRRNGEEPVDFPHPALEEILGKTYGLPLFQEQVMKMAVAVAGFSPGESDALRRAIGWQSQIHIDKLRDRLVSGMLENGLAPEYAERIFRMIQGFGGYGFPESHAASFALIGYASCYLKRYHPAALLVGLLNSQPMGFYAPHVLVADAVRHGVEVRAPCVMRSDWDTTTEPGDPAFTAGWWEASQHDCRIHCPWADHVLGGIRYGVAVQPAVRLGLRQVNGLRQDEAERLISARRQAPLTSIADVVHRAELSKTSAARLAAAGALSVLEPSRRAALWRVMALDVRAPLFAAVELPDDGVDSVLAPMTAVEIMRADYALTGLSTGLHPVALMRSELRRQGILGSMDLRRMRHGASVRVGGMVTTRQRPGTASGVIFMTLEDEDGPMNLVVYSQVYDRQRSLARDATMLIAYGQVQRTHEKVINIVVKRFASLTIPEPPVHVSRDFF